LKKALKGCLEVVLCFEVDIISNDLLEQLTNTRKIDRFVDKLVKNLNMM